MNLLYLKYFCDAVKLGGVSKAASANYVTQSAISQGIAKLEKTLATTLVARHPGRFRITPEGAQAFEKGSVLLQGAHDFEKQFCSTGEVLLGPLEFACTHSYALTVIPEALKRFRTLYPDTKVNFSVGKNGEVKKLLSAGLIDFGLLPDEGDLEAFDKRVISQGVHGLYVAKGLKAKKIASLSFILSRGDCYETQYFQSAYTKKYGKKPEVLLEVYSWEVIAKMTAEGLGIGYIPDYVARTRPEALRPIDIGLEPLQYSIAAIYPKGMRLRKASELFLTESIVSGD